MRPTGITLSACFQFLRGGLVALLGLGALFLGGLSARVASIASEGNAIERFLGGLGHFLGMALLVYALLQIVAGIGLLLLQNWARFLALFFSALGVLILLPRTIHLRPVSTLYTLLNVAVLIYLLLPQTRAYFQSGKSIQSTPNNNSSTVKVG